ncbi:hypothetical protein BDQ17DRAFT_1441071 [Cyathus striatus]|nr:hypothetical protein BDQ17DRAFT_1441071 [Cyathus striatus]
MPRTFELTYAASSSTNDAASFVVDGTIFNIELDTNACNGIEQLSTDSDRNVHISFVGQQTTPAPADPRLYVNSFAPSCKCNGVKSIFLDAFIRGLGIILIFICIWVILRWFIESKHHPHLHVSSSRSKPRTTSCVPSIHKYNQGRVSKEYRGVSIITSPVIVPGVNDACGEVDSTPTITVSDKGDHSTVYSKKNTPLPSEPSKHSSVSSEPRSQSPISVASQASTWAPPQTKWTPYSDVSKANGFSATPGVLLPPERNLTPPPPPPRTIPKFNPVLGLPQPAKIEKILQVYDFIFLIDNSGSMYYGSSWSEARESVNELANWILDNGWDRDGITLRFLNSDYLFKFQDLNGISDKNKIRQLINMVHLESGTPTGQRCYEILNAHIDKLEKAKNTQQYANIKPLILVVITDGAPTDGYEYELSRVLMSISTRLVTCCHHPEFNGHPALEVLTQLNTNGMVDAISSADLGSLSPDKLGQLMLGGVHPNVRAKGT